jgi:hypothetical protein
VTKAADNGIYIAGSHNIVESCITFGNYDSGLQIGRVNTAYTSISQWPSYNLILACESYNNYDDPDKLVNGTGGAGENADGFGCKLTAGVGNVFRFCHSHNNIDDGWDFYTKTATGSIGAVTLDRCISHHNGTLTNGTASSNGDRNGFKLGGSDMANEHIVTHCVSYGNGKDGFTWNSNPGALLLSNDLSFDNADANYKFGDNSTATTAVFWNNISFFTTAGTPVTDKNIGTDVDGTNCWWDKSKKQPSINLKGLIVTAADFVNDLSAYTKQTANPTRLSDSSLDLSPFGLASGSDLINAGVVPPDSALPGGVAFAYVGKPDLGPVEYGATSTTALSRLSTGALVDRLGFASSEAGIARLNLYSASGRVLGSLSLPVVQGDNKIGVPTGMRPGAVFATVELEGRTLYRGALSQVR